MILKEFIDMIKNIAFGILIALFIIKFIGGTAIVSQYSMQTTLYENDVLWVEKITPTFGNLNYGDIVTIYAPDIITSEGHTLVKRVIALENDHLLIKDGKVYVNGSAIKEDYTKGDYTKPSSDPEHSKFNNIVIEPGYLYCLGDNRTDSIWDSRNMGPINIKDVSGRVLFRFYPFNDVNGKFQVGPLVKKW